MEPVELTEFLDLMLSELWVLTAPKAVANRLGTVGLLEVFA